MPSPTTSNEAPLTTIFTPPPDCFVTPRVWSSCNKDWNNRGPFTCFWTELAGCYPPSASIDTIYLAAETGTWASIPQYHFSPGVIPDGYSFVSTHEVSSATVAAGCLSGWTGVSGSWCSSSASAVQILVANQGVAQTGSFPAIMPQISVTWESRDLSMFTPASAPVLMLERNGYIKEPTSPKASEVPSSLSGEGHHVASSSSLSTGAKAGIGIGAAILVLMLVILGVLILRRKQQRKPQHGSIRAGSPPPAEKRQAYVDTEAELTGISIAELPDTDRAELESDHEIKEADARWTPRELGGIQCRQELPVNVRRSEEPLSPALEPVSPVDTISTPIDTLSSTAPFSPIDPPPQELHADQLHRKK